MIKIVWKIGQLAACNGVRLAGPCPQINLFTAFTTKWPKQIAAIPNGLLFTNRAENDVHYKLHNPILNVTVRSLCTVSPVPRSSKNRNDK